MYAADGVFLNCSFHVGDVSSIVFEHTFPLCESSPTHSGNSMILSLLGWEIYMSIEIVPMCCVIFHSCVSSLLVRTVRE